jgi:hypothetical protein
MMNDRNRKKGKREDEEEEGRGRREGMIVKEQGSELIVEQQRRQIDYDGLSVVITRACRIT